MVVCQWRAENTTGFREWGRQTVGGDKEEAQRDMLSHFEHKCEWEKEISWAVGHHCSPHSTRVDFFFPSFHYPRQGTSDQFPLSLLDSILDFQSWWTHQKRGAVSRCTGAVEAGLPRPHLVWILVALPGGMQPPSPEASGPAGPFSHFSQNNWINFT